MVLIVLIATYEMVLIATHQMVLIVLIMVLIAAYTCPVMLEAFLRLGNINPPDERDNSPHDYLAA